MQLAKTKIAAIVAVMLTGCGTVSKVREEIKAKQPEAIRALSEPMKFMVVPRVTEMKGTILPVSEINMSKQGGAWLKKQQISLSAPNPLTLTQVVAQLAAKGLNISSDLPLDNFMFVGTVNMTDADSALRQILGGAGLDYQADEARRLVTIKPLATRTWYLNLGKRTSTYSSNGAMSVSAIGASSGAASGSGANQTQTSSSSQTSSMSGSSQSGQASIGTQNVSASSSSSGANGTGVSSAEDFWGAMDRELDTKLSVMVPAPRNAQQRNPNAGFGVPVQGMPPLQMGQLPQIPMQLQNTNPQQGDAAGLSELYTKKKIGSFSLNPETGAISVQAPHWVLNELDAYFKRVQQMFNTDIAFEGRLLLVTKTHSDSEGIDIQGFAKWASGRYGAVISNNNLGGITLGFPNGNIPSVTVGSQSVGGALLGITSPLDGLQIFNNYLSEVGNVAVIQRPMVATTSGVPGEFSNITPKYYNTVSQTAAAGGTGSAAQATINTLQQKDFGTELKINPRFDMATGLIRAQISMRNVMPAGEQSIPQTVSAGNTTQTVITRIPLERKLNYSGEALLRDGDLIVVGGQSEETLQTDENGLPSGNGPIGGIFGVKRSTTSGGTYYFALKVSVKKR